MILQNCTVLFMYFLFKNNRTHNPQHEFKVIAKQTNNSTKKIYIYKKGKKYDRFLNGKHPISPHLLKFSFLPMCEE